MIDFFDLPTNPPASPKRGAGGFAGIQTPDDDFFGTDEVEGGSSSTAADPGVARAVFAGASELPGAPERTPSTLRLMGRDVVKAGRVANQARAGFGVGAGDAIAQIPSYLADFAVNGPLSVLATLEAAAVPAGANPLDVPAARQMHRNREKIRQVFEPVAQPVHETLTKGADAVYGTPGSSQDALGRAVGEITGNLAGGAIPLPSVAKLGGRALEALQGLGERGAAGSAPRLAAAFGRTNKGYLETTEVARRLLDHTPDEAVGLATQDLAGSQRVVELPGGSAGKVIVRPDDHLFTTRVTPEHKAAMTSRLVDGIMDDVRAGLADPEIANGAGWYRESVKQMEGELQQVFPELADPNKMGYAKLLIAMTSPNNAPEPNLRQAMDIYSRYRLGLHGGEPSAVAAGVSGTLSSKEIDQKVKSLEMVRQIFTEEAGGNADQGLADLMQWLQQPGPQRKGRAPEPIINDLLGRKTSNFWMNLMGNDQHVTADVWAIRGARRHWGYQVLETKRVPDGKGGFFSDPSKLTLEGAPTDPEYDAIEDAYKIAAERISQETGQPLSPMDVQAITWYREKKLYEQTGAIPSGLDDFASAAKAFRESPTEVLDPAAGDLALRDLSTPYGRMVRPRHIAAMDDAEALRRINAPRNAGTRDLFTAGEITDPEVARQMLLKSEKGALGSGEEKVVSAAIRLDDGTVVTGVNHADAVEKAGNPRSWQDGFVTSTGRYVDRQQAYEIASGKAGGSDHLVADDLGAAGSEGVSGAELLTGLSAGPAVGSVGGGLAGGQVGDSPEERRKNALIGATAGAVAGIVGAPALVRGAQEISRGLRSERSVAPLIDDLLARPDGFTFDPRVGRFVEGEGVMVANPPGAKASVIDELTPEAVQKVMDDNKALFRRPGIMLGGWRDGQTGKYYLEPAEAAPDVPTALKLAKERNERAVFDLSKLEEIRNPDFAEAGSLGAPSVEDLQKRIARAQEQLKTANGEQAVELEGDIAAYKAMIARLGNERGALGTPPASPTPSPAPAPTGPVADDYVNLSKFATDPSGEARLRKEAERLGPAVIGDPKEVVTWAETRDRAAEIAADIGLGKVNPKRVNTRLSGDEMLAIRNIVSQNLSRIGDLVKRTLKPGGDAEADALIAAIEVQNDALLRKFIRSRSATGRDLNNLKILANATMDPMVWLAKADNMLRAGGKKLTSDQALAIQKFAAANDRQGLVAYIADLRPASAVEKGLTLWKAGLLTSPSTHVANVAGNTMMAGMEIAKDAPAAVIDRVLSLATGQRTKDFHPVAATQASFQGARAGLRDAKLVMQGKLRPRAMKGEIDREVNFESPILDAYTKTVFRALEAQDQVFLQSAIRRSLAEQARVIARGNKAQAQALMKAPTDEMVIQALADADYATFRESTPFTRGLTNLRESTGAVGHVIAPFVKTPTNIARTVIDYSPAGMAKAARNTLKLLKLVRDKASPEEIAAVQRLASEQAGRSATGAIPVAVGYLLAKHGMATGARPTSKSEYEEQQLEGKQPNAVNIGGDWRAIARFAPLGNLVAFGANLYHIQNDPELSASDKAIGGAASIGTTILETPFLQGVDQLQQVLSDPKRAGVSYIENTAASTVPNIVRRTSRSLDPVVRDTKSDKAGFAGLADETGRAVVAGTPFSRTLPPRINQFGEPMTRSLNILEALFDPTNPRPDAAGQNTVIRALERAGASIGQVAKKKGESPSQYRQRQIDVGQQVKQVLTELVAEGVVDADSLEQAVRKVRRQDTLSRKADEDFFGVSPADTTTSPSLF